MTTLVKPARGPGRPSTGARERVLDAGRETLLAEGFAGLTYAKVAALAGENKSLISYYFGSKQGLVAAVAELIGNEITTQILREIQKAKSAPELVEGLMSGVWNVMDEDRRVARLYFDLSAVSVVDAEVRVALTEVKARWREVLGGYLRELSVPSRSIEAVATFLVAGAEGLAIEKLEVQDSDRIGAAREIFISASSGVIADLVA